MSSLNEFSLLSKSENFIVRKLCNLDEFSIDVGAARGDFANQMSLYSNFVLAIEPNPIKIKQLIASRKNIQLFENAASFSHGKNVVLRVVTATPANSTIEPLNTLEGFAGIEYRNVETIRIDNICNNPVSFMKIDCEGHDFDVLLGSEDLILKSSPSILIELRDKHNPGYLVKTFMYLLEKDYIPFIVTEDDLIEISFENNLNKILVEIIIDQESEKNKSQDNFLFVKRIDHKTLVKAFKK